MSKRDPQGFSVEYAQRAVGNRVRFGKSTPFLSTAGVYVLPNDPLASDTDNNPNTPYLTIQAAVDDAIKYGRLCVFAQPGAYDETIVVRDGQLNLIALGEKDSVVVLPQTADMPALVVTDATEASLAAWLAGGSANYDANYAGLQAGATYGNCLVFGFELVGEGNCYGAVAVGAGGAPNPVMHLNEKTQSRSWLSSHAVYARQAGVTIQDAGSETILTHQYDFYDASLFAIYSEIGALHMQGASTLNGHFSIFEQITLDDTSEIGDLLAASGGAAQLHINGILTLNDTSIADLRGGYINGNIQVGGDAQLDMKDVHVQGAQNYINAGAAVACTMDGGRYIGVLTDPGARLTRTLGS